MCTQKHFDLLVVRVKNCESLGSRLQLQSSKIDKGTLLAIGLVHAILVQAAPPPQAAGIRDT